MIYSSIDNPKCRICTHADIHTSDGNVTCDFKGTVPEDFCCRKFKYDIFKKTVRVHKKLNAKKYCARDFMV